ncbi:cyclin-dependent protein kinase inhibitor SIM-like [Salvia miltiorrhiza]|uniref:cyclin-dependent protein kinase inhibitor SIM-like n=1 Tax=Salvia miltiorrhiza TaxID=226208 RepID=UPI0025ABCD60|nr:cyclin-dependent protein kinase inhibitor SIM-like [Salvia miltiorrhiza]
MSQHPSTNRANPDRVDEIEDGYETPTSEEHRIPPVCLDCPPPPPRKRKRFFMDRRISIGKVVLRGSRIVEEEELESFFELLESQSPPPPPPPLPEPESESEPEQDTSPKKIRSHQ